MRPHTFFSKTTKTSGVTQLGSVIKNMLNGLGLCLEINRAKAIFLVFFLFAWGLCNFPAAAQSAPGDEHWDYRFGRPGANGAVLAIAVQGNEAYVGGSLITTIGNVVATNIAKWDGHNWAALGSGISSAGQAMVIRIAFGPNGDQLTPFQRAIFVAATPPAAVKLPPAYKSPLGARAIRKTIACPAALMPFPSADQLCPSHFAILVATTFPMVVIKDPPT